MSDHSRASVSLRTAALMAAGAVGIFYGGMYAARATPGGEVRKGLSFAGTLTGVSGKQTLTFTFTNKTTGVTCAVPSKDTHENGSFVAELPIDACPANLFDGGDVTYSVKVGDEALPGDFNVNPVPYAKYAEQAGTPDCPAGYAKNKLDSKLISERPPLERIVCQKDLGGGVIDEVVRVGVGKSAFWIDRYESSVYTQEASGPAIWNQFPTKNDPDRLPFNGQIAAIGLQKGLAFSASVKGVGATADRVHTSGFTWFQADLACRIAGKRLPTGVEWLAGARGTPDPGVSTGAGGTCNTKGGGIRFTGSGTGCESIWGAQDMIGNVWEWTADWYAGAGFYDGMRGASINSAVSWPDGYGADGTINVASHVERGNGATDGLPAAGLRGGGFSEGADAGIHALSLNVAPSFSGANLGFRCVIPR